MAHNRKVDDRPRSQSQRAPLPRDIMASLLERYNKWRHGNNASTSTDSLTKAVAQISINPTLNGKSFGTGLCCQSHSI